MYRDSNENQNLPNWFLQKFNGICNNFVKSVRGGEIWAGGVKNKTFHLKINLDKYFLKFARTFPCKTEYVLRFSFK